MNIKFLGPQGHFIDGIPARNLTRAEWDALSPDDQKMAVESGLYEVQNEAAYVSRKKTDKVEE